MVETWCVNKQESTNEDINKLIEFRQVIYENGMLARRDALFDLLDALISEGSISSFAMLSQSSRFRRKWSSLYAAVEDGELDSAWLRNFLARQVPQQGICVFPMDGSPWPRPRSRVLDDRQFVYQATSAVNGGTVTIGYPYSLLEWCVEPHSSWSLLIDGCRVASSQTPQELGAEQIQALAEARAKCSETWGTPDEVIELEDPYWRQVHLEHWNGLHEKKDADVPYDVIRACVHLERSRPPAALWLAWLAPHSLPNGIAVTVETIWRAYSSCWPVEPSIHFRKETLGWTLPRFQTKEAGDRWTELTSIVCWMIFLARPIVEDTQLPWQKPQQRLTPQRVQQSIRLIMAGVEPQKRAILWSKSIQ